jgi:hypothetical protein
MDTARKSNEPDPTPHKKVTPGIGGDMADAGSMDKIRDILFGHQAKDYEKRFLKMENHLNQEVGELKDELLKRINTLEGYVKQEIKDIHQRIKNESNERVESEKILHRELKEVVESLTKKLLNDEENLSKKSTELRDQILEQSKQFSSEIISKFDQAANNLKKAAQELDEAKVNRSDLSGFFLEIAMRLSGDDNMGSKNNTQA